MARKVIGVAFATAVVGVAIALYVADWATTFPTTVVASANPLAAGGGSRLTLQTVGSLGNKFGGNPGWVSYLVKNGSGKWVHTTIFQVPAHTVVHVTLYQFDSATGLRNPLWSQVQGTVGNTMTVNGKTVNAVPPETPAHTFAIPELGVYVPLPGFEEGKHFCEEAPCEPSVNEHNTITFSFRTGKPGHYRWQCFVPCGAGFLNGNGGPMQTLGYMDGFIDVV